MDDGTSSPCKKSKRTPEKSTPGSEGKVHEQKNEGCAARILFPRGEVSLQEKEDAYKFVIDLVKMVSEASDYGE